MPVLTEHLCQDLEGFLSDQRPNVQADSESWEEGTGRDTALSSGITQSTVRIHSGRTTQTQQEQ